MVHCAKLTVSFAPPERRSDAFGHGPSGCDRRPDVTAPPPGRTSRGEHAIAVIGTGAIAHDHVRAITATPGLRVAFVAGSDAAHAAAVAALAPGAVVSTDPTAAINDPSVAGVDVCGHTAAHARWAIVAGAAGKHVMVEKPAALTLDELDDMLLRTRASSLLVGQTARFQPVVGELHSRLVAGDIGRPRLIHIQWYAAGVWPRGWRAWQLDRTQSGGHPLHNGVHAFDLLAWLTGQRPVRVFTRAFRSAAAQMPVPDNFHVTVRMDDGTLALVEIGYALRAPTDVLRRVSVIGERGTLVHTTEDDPGLVSAWAPALPASTEGAFERQVRHWRDVLDGLAKPVTTPEELRAALALGLAAQRSLDCADVVAVSTSDSEAGTR
jgi:predicted dehydrogenase